MASEFDERIVGTALTFDDVLLLPAYSDVLPSETDVKTMLTRELPMSIPIISAAMDTVTEARMAIAMAREGGIGIIHKNMSIERQVEEVKKVKRAESGKILEPYTLEPDDTVRDALLLMERHKISGIPIVDKEKRLLGLVTRRDLRFEEYGSKPLKEVMTPVEDIIVAPIETTLAEAEKILREHRIEKLPLVDDKGRLAGLITFKDIKQLRQYPNANKDELGRLRVGAAVSARPHKVLDHARALVEAGVDVLVVDSAHGHTYNVIETVKVIKRNLDIQVIAGNVATREGARALVEAGADAVKVGIGPGSICTTRIVAGVGVPQITAIMWVAGELKGTGVPVIADGGIRYSGDIVKAIAAGADSVMLGSLLAGTDEAPGETIIYEGRKYKVYRGMGSLEAMKEGSGERYFQEEATKFVPEGVVGRVPYKGSVSEVLFQLVGGLRSGMGYCGVKTIPELKVKARFVKQTLAGIRESHVHDIDIIREAPNYSR